MINRITEILALLCVAAALVVLVFSSRLPAGDEPLAGMRVQDMSQKEGARFTALLDQARQAVDSNSDPVKQLEELTREFPGRHEAWALDGRYREAAGFEEAALLSYARAVRLEPDYLDDGSNLYLGRRIERLTGRVLQELEERKRSGGLNEPGRQMLKTAYFLKRRLAGGCE